jgi:hypothetical protein
MRNILFILGIIYIFVSACSGKKHNAVYYESQLDSLNRNVMRGLVDTNKMNQISKDIDAFVENNKTDSAAPKLLFNLARTQQSHRMFHQAVSTLQDLRKRYPESDYSSKALVMEGYIFANDLKQYEEGKKSYNEYLSRYKDKDTNLTRSIELEIRNLGKTAEQIMEEFEEARRMADSIQNMPQ